MNTTDQKRAAAVKAFDIINSLPEEAYDNITRLASYICEVPVALITFIEADSQFYKSVYGADFNIRSIKNSICYYAIQQDAEITIIENTHDHPNLKDNPYVVSKPHISFYAGVLLKTPEHIPIGTLCVVDYKPNSLSANQIEALKSLAVQVEQLLTLRKSKIETRQSKTKLLEKTHRLNNLIQASQVGTWEWNVQTGDIIINDRYAEMLGYTKEELQPTTLKTWYELVHPEDAKLSDALLKKCFNKELDFYEIECRMIHKDGHTVWINDRGKVVEWTEDGKPLIMMGTHTDINTNKNNEIRLQNIANNIPGALFRYYRKADGSDQFINVSQGAVHLWGYQPDEITADSGIVWKNIHPDDVKGLIQSIDRAYETLDDWVYEWRYLHPNGETKWQKGSGRHSKINNDTIAWDCFTLDITERKNADNIVLANEKRFKALVQEGSDLISILDREGVYKYVSPTSKRVLGIPSEHLMGKKVREFIHPDDWQEVEQKFNLLQEQKQITTKPFRYKNSNNEWRWIETTATNLLDDPTIEGIVTNSRDVTERIFNEKELKLSNERYNIINKATNDAIYDWDIEKDMFYWGDGFERLFGHQYKLQEFRLQDWINFTHPKDVLKHKKRWDAFFQDKKQNTWKNEFRFLKEDNTYAYVEENGFMIRDTKGKPLRMIGTLRDITASKISALQQQVEFEVGNFFKEHSPKLTETLDKVLDYLLKFSGFDTAEVWLSRVDDKNLLLFKVHQKNKTSKIFYRASKEVNEFNRGEGLPGTIWQQNSIQVLDNIDTNKNFNRRRAAKLAGLKSAAGIPLIHNQKTIGVLVFGSKHQANQVREDIKIFESLGHYLGAEIKRKQQEEEIQLFFDNAPEIMAVADPNGYFVKVNPAFCSILGYTKEELTSKPFTHFLHPDDLEKTHKKYTETISGKRLANNFINRYRTKKGDFRWISWSSSEIFGEDGLAYAYGRDITELIELQRLFEKAAKLAKIGSWELDLRDSAGKNNVYWSAMTREVMEVDETYNPTHSAGLEFCLGEHKRNLSQAVQTLIKTGEPFDLELQILSAKGNLKWVRCIGESERFEGKCIKVFGSYQDIDQRKQAEIKVNDALAERNNILESIGDGFFAVDQDWHVTYWNNKAEELLLTKKEDILGKKLWDVFADHVGLKSYHEYNKAMNYLEVVHFEDHYPENNSWLEVSAYPSKTGLSVFFKDITERKLQEKIIRESNERFEKVTEATNDAVWDFDVVNNQLFWGKGFENQFGFNLKKTTPTLDFLVSRIHPEDRPHVAAKIEKYMTDGTSTHWFEEYRFKKADGSYAFIIDRAVFIRDKNGQVTRVIGAMTDISYRKEYEESLQKLNERLQRHSKELEISNQELEQFAYVTSHDLQEPLRMISSFLMLLEKKYGDKLDDKALEYIYFAVDGAKRMKKIILDLLEFSKVGRFDEEKSQVAITDVIEEYTALRKKIIAEKEAQIHFEKLPVITSYRIPLTQVFHNLLDNAIKYSREGFPPKIQINAREHKKYWEFSVQDNGIGINAEYFNKIFIIFQRLHNNDVYEGTGMGLAIVKKIIDTLDGKIGVTSEPGKGSIFSFTIPKTN